MTRKHTILLLIPLLSLVLTACSKSLSFDKNAADPAVPSKVAIEDYQAMPLCESASGYYFNRSTETSPMGIHYVDKGTGKDVLLCNKPECRHDGNEFCVATNKNYCPFAMQLYDNALYAGAICVNENNFEVKLIKIALDGSYLSEVATIFSSNLATNSDPRLFNYEDKMIIHRGMALFHVRIDGNEQMEDVIAYGTAIYDLNEGTLKYYNEEPISTDNPQLINVTARGDAFYFIIMDGRKRVLHKYHLNDGTDEPIDLLANFTGEYAVMNNGNVFYLRSMKKNLYVRLPDGTNKELDEISMSTYASNCLDPDSVMEGLPLELLPMHCEFSYPGIGASSLYTDGEKVFARFNSISNFYETVEFELPEELDELTYLTDKEGRGLTYLDPSERRRFTSVCYFNLSNYLRFAVYDSDGGKLQDLEVAIPVKDSSGQEVDPVSFKIIGVNGDRVSLSCNISPYFTANKVFAVANVYPVTGNTYGDSKVLYVEESTEDFLAGKPFNDPIWQEDWK